MAEIRSPDGRFVYAVQGDGNEVVYDTSRGHPWTPVWDRWGWEATHGHPPAAQPAPAPVVPPIGQTRLIKITDERDGELVNRGYSYWSQAWVAPNGSVVVFVGHRDGLTRFFHVPPDTGAVARLGARIPYRGEAEGWYFDEDGWIYLPAGPRLRRVNPLTGEDHVVFNISNDHPGCDIFQTHSSEDGQTHSATVRRIVDDGAYPKLGTVVSRHGRQMFFEAQGVLDESAIDTSGRFLVIKEDNDNRIIDLQTGRDEWLRDEAGAFGHSDLGDGCIVGEDDQAGACVWMDLLTRQRRPLFSTWGMGHVSVRGGRCLLSDDTYISLVALDGSGVTRLVAHGMVGTDYDHQVHGNLSPCGRVAAFVSNKEGRFELYLLIL